VPERLERIFRIGCILLAALLLLRFALAVHRATLLHNVAIPALPRLAETNTNQTAATDPAPGTNHPALVNTNKVVAATRTSTNAPAATSGPGTNLASAAKSATNAAVKPETNPIAKETPAPHPPRGPRGGPRKDDLPAPVKDQVDKIVKSGVLAPYMPPMPAALLGIADDEAFLRAGNGQTGAIKEGAELGNLKLLRIGVNRVLVEEDGEKKELTVFGGAGGESLMPPPASAPATNAPPTSNTNRQTAIKEGRSSNATPHA